MPAVEWKKGELRLPNWLVFNFYPLLRLDERVVYEELYLWTHGFGENPRVISQKKIAARLGIDEKRLQRIITKLAEKGLVQRLDGRYGGTRDERGTLFDVRLPHVMGAPTTGAPPTAGGQPTAGGRPTAGAPPIMKEEKAIHERAAAGAAPDIYRIRTIGARLFERHKADLGFDHERLASLVADALAAQGITPDAAMIEEAIRGMAV